MGTTSLSKLAIYAKDKISVGDLSLDNYVSTENLLPDKGGLVKATNLPTVGQTAAFSKNDILVSNIRPYFKKILFAKLTGGCSNDVLVFRAKPNTDPRFLYYILSDDAFFDYSMSTSKGTKMPRGDKTALMNYVVPDLDITIQRKIASVLSAIDDRIELNERMNKNLMEQVLALYKASFLDSIQDRKVCKAEEFFDVTIGKTPPRKEQEWFTERENDIRWVSISDMGSCGTYISDSSERLTQSAIDRFNVVVVPDDTVLLSFKLTVGRIAITDGPMATNEAIAHFKTTNKKINPYLYCYLKLFKYGELGSTSSIATAVNSKIIKAMPFVIPNEHELDAFNEIALPAFDAIKAREKQNKQLAKLRDTLLPKLMSGEIDMDSVEI